MRHRFRSVRARFLTGIFLVSLAGTGALALDHDRYLAQLMETVARSQFSSDALTIAGDISARVAFAQRECLLLTESVQHAPLPDAAREAARYVPPGSGVLAFALARGDGTLAAVERTAECPRGVQLPSRVGALGGGDAVAHVSITRPDGRSAHTLAVSAPVSVSSAPLALVAILDPAAIFASANDASTTSGRSTSVRTGAGAILAGSAPPQHAGALVTSTATLDFDVAGEPEPWSVSVSMPRAIVLANIGDLRRHTVITLCAIACGGFLLSLLLSRQITRPLRRLQRGAEIIANGDLAHELPVETRDEIGDVARALQSMTHSLRDSLSALENERQSLAKRVADRTEALRSQGDELARANHQLRSLDRLKSDFITNVSHELRTPFTMIYSTLEALDAPQPFPEEHQARLLTIARDGATRLGAILNQIIAYADVEAGPETWTIERLDVRALAGTAVGEMSARAHERGVHLTILCGEDSLFVDGSADKLRLALSNLLSNAVTYTQPGGRVDVKVYGRERRGVPLVRVDVRDTGCGIATEDIPRLFERFAQGGSILTEKPQGTGLGLPITRRVVEQHGGTITVASRVGKGSTFSIDLPGVAADDLAAAA